MEHTALLLYLVALLLYNHAENHNQKLLQLTSGQKKIVQTQDFLLLCNHTGQLIVFFLY